LEELDPLIELDPAFRILEAILFREAKNLFFDAVFLEEERSCLTEEGLSP